MDWLSFLVFGVGGFSVKTLVLHGYMTSEVSDFPDHVYEPLFKTSIILPTFNEELWVGKTLESLQNQTVILEYPEFFEVIVVDNGSTDDTVEVAKKYTSNVLSLTERGKLNALHMGALDATGEIIITVDSDTKYFPNWLNLLIKPFKDGNVNVVVGPILSDDITTVGYMYTSLLDGYLFQKINGCNTAFLKSSYLKAGGWDTSINEFDKNELFQAEIKLSNQLRNYGNYVFNPKASVFTSSRRWYCAVRGSEYACSRAGPEMCQYCMELAQRERF